MKTKLTVLLAAFLLATAGAFAQVSVSLAPVAKQQFLDSNGVPVVGGKLCTYVTGTTTPQATYTDSTGTTTNTNPVVLDSAGRASIWLPQGVQFRFTLYDSTGTPNTCDGNLIWQEDGVSSVSLSSGGVMGGTFSGNPIFSGNPSFTGSPTVAGNGTSGVVALPVIGSQVFNIKAYGAKGDAAANDSPAFQAAYAAAVAAGGGTVLIPPTSACYLLSTTINMTNSTTPASFPIIAIQGTGGGLRGAVQTANAGICGNTGGIVFDVSGTDSITFKNVYVTANVTGLATPSTIGIYAARNGSNSGAQNINVINSTFNMPIHSTGSPTTYGIYLYGSEDDYFYGDWLMADRPLTVTATNVDSVNSAFITQATGTQSQTQDSFYALEVNTAGVAPAVHFDGASDIILEGHSWESTANPTSHYALEFAGSNSVFHVKWRQEGYPGWAHVALSLNDCNFSGTSAPGSSTPLHAIEFTDASAQLRGDRFEILDEYASPSANAYYDGNEASPAGVAVLDDVDFFCGGETDCVDIPYGNFATGGALYWHNVTWSGNGSNQYPTISLVHPLTGTFSIPNSAVTANTCTALASVTAGAVATSTVRISPQFLYNLIVTGAPANGSFTPYLCNPTAASQTPALTTARWTVAQ